MAADANAWDGPFWTLWEQFHTGWVGVTLVLALILTVYSMLDYLWSYRSLVGLRS
jgi:hypothetical protein